MRTGAIIIAAGHRSSLGSFQPMLPVGDSTVIRRIIITLKRAGADPVVAVTGARGDEVEKHISGLQVICLRNKEYEHVQMYDSICKGLNYIEDLCDRVLLLPAKFPMFLPRTIERMLESRSDIVCPVFGGRRGHPVLISAELLPALLSYRGDLGLRGAIRSLEKRAVLEEIPVEDEGIILAVETGQDLERGDFPVKRLDIYPQVRLTLERDEGFFGPSTAGFLSLIDHTGSMQTACRQMHMSYTKGWKTLKEAERELGYPLLATRSGGAEGGCSLLTPKARELLKAYLAMEKELKEQAQLLYKKYFEGEKDGDDEGTI